MRQDLIDDALDSFPDLCESAGLPVQGWSHKVMSVRNDDIARVAILKLSHREAGDLALKLEARFGESFAQRMEEHKNVQNALFGNEGLTCPRLLAYDDERGTALMEWFDGRPMADVLGPEVELEEHEKQLERAGRWLSAFHRARQGDERIFQPKHGFRTLKAVKTKVEQGQQQVAERATFLAALGAMNAKRADWQDQQTQAAAQHGDLHMRNILLGKTQVAGIDFAGGHMAPVGHDIARLLIDYVSIAAPLEALRRREIVPERALAAFFAGYDLVDADDPSVQMMLHMRVLIEWYALPATQERMSPTKARRLVGLMHVAKSAFEL